MYSPEGGGFVKLETTTIVGVTAAVVVMIAASESALSA